MFLPLDVSANTPSSSFNVDIEINNCNYNNVCEASIGEDFPSCPVDCPATCTINGVCETRLGEDIINCAADCVVIVIPTTTTSTIPTAPSVGNGGGGAFTNPHDVVFNVIDLAVKSGDSFVKISWKVPNQSDYGGVLIRRSEIFTPSTINDGGILYNGFGESDGNSGYHLNDLNLTNGRWYFYTIFLYNKNGSFASGASVAALPQSKTMQEYLIDLFVPPKRLPPELSIPSVLPILLEKDLLLPKINYIQESGIVVPENPGTHVYYIKPIVTTTVVVENQYVPKNTKSIAATIDDGVGFITYLLSRDEYGNYLLNIPGGVLFNNNKIIFTFIDQNNQSINRVETVVNTIKNPVISPNQSIKYLNILILTINWFISLIYLIFDIVVLLVKLLQHWVSILGVLVIHT